jgi:hypothetical protein
MSGDKQQRCVSCLHMRTEDRAGGQKKGPLIGGLKGSPGQVGAKDRGVSVQLTPDYGDGSDKV